MYEYIIGKITDINSGYIVIDNNGIGYKVYTSNPYSFKIEDEVKVYIYQQIREDDNSLYGFKTSDEKELFLKLTSVKGLGCKMALPMLSVSSDELMSEIEKGNINYLKKFPKIGDKVARQIILDLKGKLVSKEDNNVVDDELKEALIALGYKVVDINKIISKVDSSSNIQDKIKEALKLLMK